MQPTAFRFTWPGSPEQEACQFCANRAKTIAHAMGFELEVLPLNERKPMFYRCTVCQAKHDPPLPPAQHSVLTHCPTCGGTVTLIAHDTERPPAGEHQVVEGEELDHDELDSDDDGLGERLPRIGEE